MTEPHFKIKTFINVLSPEHSNYLIVSTPRVRGQMKNLLINKI